MKRTIEERQDRIARDVQAIIDKQKKDADAGFWFGFWFGMLIGSVGAFLLVVAFHRG